MNCPHCHQELPGDYLGGKCPQCGALLANDPERRSPTGLGGSQDVSRSETGAPRQPAPCDLELKTQRQPGGKFPTLIFFLLLLGPPVLTLLAAALGGDNDRSAPIAIGLCGGGAGGIACGLLLGRRVGQTLTTKIMLGLVMAAVMAPVCIFLCFIGCSMGGWQLNLR